MGALLCNGLSIKWVLDSFELHLPASEWLSLSLATTAANYLTPARGGAALRAGYLKARHQFPLLDFVSSLSAMYFVYLFAHGVLGLLGMALAYQRGLKPDPALLGLFAATTGGALLPFLLPRFGEGKRGIAGLIARVTDGWSLLRKNRRTFAGLVGATIGYTLLSAVQAKVAFNGLQVEMPWDTALVFTAGQDLALLVSLTPGAIGFVDAMSIYMGDSLAYSTAEALAEQALVRIVLWSLLLVLAPVAFQVLGWKFLSKPAESDSE